MTNRWWRISLSYLVSLLMENQARNVITMQNESTQNERNHRTSVSWIRYAGICWMLDWSWTDLLSGFGKGHSNEGRAQCFGVHLHSSSTQVVILPSLHIGWLVPINQPFLNYTRSYACTDSRVCSQWHVSVQHISRYTYLSFIQFAYANFE